MAMDAVTLAVAGSTGGTLVARRSFASVVEVGRMMAAYSAQRWCMLPAVKILDSSIFERPTAQQLRLKAAAMI